MHLIKVQAPAMQNYWIIKEQIDTITVFCVKIKSIIAAHVPLCWNKQVKQYCYWIKNVGY